MGFSQSLLHLKKPSLHKHGEENGPQQPRSTRKKDSWVGSPTAFWVQYHSLFEVLNYHHQGSVHFFWIFLFFRTNDGALSLFSNCGISPELSGAAVFGVSCDIVPHNRPGHANTTDRREKSNHNIGIEPLLKGHLPSFQPCNWPETHLYKIGVCVASGSIRWSKKKARSGYFGPSPSILQSKSHFHLTKPLSWKKKTKSKENRFYKNLLKSKSTSTTPLPPLMDPSSSAIPEGRTHRR